MKLTYLLYVLPFATTGNAQLAGSETGSRPETAVVDERLVNYKRLPKVFNWYDVLIKKFVPEKKGMFTRLD